MFSSLKIIELVFFVCLNVGLSKHHSCFSASCSKNSCGWTGLQTFRDRPWTKVWTDTWSYNGWSTRASCSLRHLLSQPHNMTEQHHVQSFSCANLSGLFFCTVTVMSMMECDARSRARHGSRWRKKASWCFLGPWRSIQQGAKSPWGRQDVTKDVFLGRIGRHKTRDTAEMC